MLSFFCVPERVCVSGRYFKVIVVMPSDVIQAEKCRQYLQKLSEMDELSMFSKPVNSSEVVGYDQIVDSPMDLSTISCKLEKCNYRSDGDLEDDVVLMISNALKFNPRGSPFYALADKFRRTYHDVALSVGLAVDTDTAYIPSKRRRDEDDDESTLLKAESKGVENMEDVLRGLTEDQGVSLDELRQKYERAKEMLKLNEDSNKSRESTDNGTYSEESGESGTSTESGSSLDSDSSDVNSESDSMDDEEASDSTSNTNCSENKQ